MMNTYKRNRSGYTVEVNTYGNRYHAEVTNSANGNKWMSAPYSSRESALNVAQRKVANLESKIETL